MYEYVKRAARIAGVLAVGLSLTACATVTRGTKQMWHADSTPTAAKVSTDRGYNCTTPCWLKLPRKNEFRVTISKDGYKPFEGRVDNSIGAGGGVALAGNVLLGGLIGVGVDAVSGASLELNPNPLFVVLEPVGSSDESHFDTTRTDKPKPPKN